MVTWSNFVWLHLLWNSRTVIENFFPTQISFGNDSSEPKISIQ